MADPELLFDPELSTQRIVRVYNKTCRSKARTSLPDMLSIKKIGQNNGVYAKCSISRLTQFGPLEAPLVTKKELDNNGFVIKLDIHKCKRLENVDASYIYYDMSDENMCNWMMFVQAAKSYVEQNICAHQEEDFIFYTTVRDISPNEELKVWYSPTYAKFLSVPVLTATSGAITSSKVSSNSRKTKASVRMQVYLNSERDVRSVPPKKRRWKRSKDKKRDGIDFFPSQSLSKRVVRKTFVKIPQNHTCSVCGKVFKQREKLKIHQVVHSSIRNFLCHICGATFKRKDKLNDHIGNVHNAKTKHQEKKQMDINQCKYKCTKCMIGFQRRGMFINHFLKKHPDINTNSMAELSYPIYKPVLEYKCPYCVKVYKSSTKRKLHIQRQHPGNELPVSIKQAKSAYNFENIQNSEITLKEKILLKPECCSHCNRQYTSKNKLKKHILEKHNINSGYQVIYTRNSVPPNLNVPSKPISGNNLSQNVGRFPENPQSQIYELGNVLYPTTTHPYNSQTGDFQNSLSTPHCSQTLYNDAVSTTPQIVSRVNMTESEPLLAKSNAYSRYPLGRKQILKAYESSQNFSETVSDPTVEKIAQNNETWKPYKARLLHSESPWRYSESNSVGKSNCATDNHTDVSFTDLQVTQPELYPSTSSVLETNGTNETMLDANRATSSDVMPVLNDHDMNDFVNACHDSDTTSSNWIYPQDYENIGNTYISR